jgi:glucose-6-phosphate-specific signal transduction histidine kinase
MLRDFITTNTFWLYLIITTSLITILIEIFSLSHGISDFFPYFFLIPMLLVIYAFPKKGILFTVAMGWIYIALVYVFGTFSTRVIAVDTAWFFIYVSLGIVISSRVISSRAKTEQVEQLKRKAFHQIERNMEQFEILNDQIRNPLQAIVLDLETIPQNPTVKESILEQVQIIDKILTSMDENNLESEKVRKYLQKHYDFEK